MALITVGTFLSMISTSKMEIALVYAHRSLPLLEFGAELMVSLPEDVKSHTAAVMMIAFQTFQLASSIRPHA